MTLFTLQNQVLSKALALFVALVMVLSLVPASVFAQAEGETPAELVDEQQMKQDDTKPIEEDKPKPENPEKENVFQLLINTVSDVLNIESDKKIKICHATGNGSYKIIEPNINGLKNGHANSGVNSGDIVPPTPGTDFADGQNWNTVGQAIWNNECKVSYEETNDIIVVSQSTLTGPTGSGWYFEGSGLNVAPFVFNTAAAKIGDGSLFVGPVGAVPQNKFIGLYQNVTPVKNLKSIAYDYKIVSNSTADENEFYLNVYANFGTSNPFKFYDCRYDVVPTTGSLVDFTTVTFDPTVIGKLAKEAVVGTCPATLAGMEAASPGSVVRAIALNVGDTEAQDAGVSGHFDKVVIKTQDDTNYTKNTTTFDFEPKRKPKEVTVVATKIVCTDEAQLPNWGGNGPAITSTTASDWVVNNQSCSLAKDWQFQYADQNGPDTAGNFVGEATGYTTFANPTGVNGVSTQIIPLGKGVSELHLREVLKDGYIPFTKSSDTVSAEFYCADDVLNYDNWDFIRNPESGATYHCVAWNVKNPQETVKVHIYKYLQNGEVIAQVPNDSTAPDFPMVATWNATNIGGGTGNYVLGNNHGGAAFDFAADTSAMSVPADYTTSEVTGGASVVLPADAKCEVGKYRLIGYKQGDSVAAAESATLTTTAPVYNDITTDKYVIVVNEKCPDIKPVCAIGENLIQNGSFENTPAVTANGGKWQIFAGGIINWLATLSSGLEVWNTFNGTGNDIASDGLQNVELDGDDKTNIAQDVATIPGATYELKFDYSARAATALADSKMDAMINGVSALSVNTDGSAATGNVWEPKTTTFVAVGTSTKISFEDKGAANLDGGFGPLLDNVSLCLTKEPVPEPVCTLTIKSDVMDYVVEKNAMAQALSTINGAWVTALGTSTAAWVWGDNPVVNPTVAETQTFKKGFNWTGGAVTSATLKLSSDNTHKVTLGAFGVTDSGEFNYGPTDISTYNVATGITAGANTLEIAVGNIPMPGSTAAENPAGLMYELTITGTGKSCGTVVPEVPVVKTATVTMCKVDSEEEKLSGWQLALLGSKVGDVDVLPNGTTYSIPAVPTGSYVVKGSGTYQYRGLGLPVDATFSTRKAGDPDFGSYPYQPWLNSAYWGAPGYLSLQVNNVPHLWGSVFNPAHVYYQPLTQVATSAVDFKITDNAYGDNSGKLKAEIFNGRTGVTGRDGCVTFTEVPYGTYTTEELMQAGWENESGLGSVEVDSPKVIFTIVNEEEDGNSDEEYILDGFKYACTDDYDVRLSENDNEEKYYNCDKDDVVEGWKIYATNDDTDEELSTTTDKNGYYYFEVEGGEWTVSEGDDGEGEWEQVAAEINGKDYGDFSCTFEEVEDNEPSFFKRVTDNLGLTDSDSDEEYYGNQCDFYNYFYEDYTPKTYTVTGFKWNDVNGDGVKDAEEGKLANWVIKAVKGSTTVSTTTNASGNYTLVLPYDEGTWVVSETLQGGWAQTGRYQNGTKVTLGGEVSNNCSFDLGIIAPTATCDFGNKQNTVVIIDPETPTNQGRNGGSGTRVTNRVTPTGLVLGAATGTPACGMYLNDYMRMGNAASTTQVTKLQVFLNAVGITAPLNGVFDAATDAAVRTFQAQYKSEVLTPWYLAKIVPHDKTTGWVYQLTRWKINNIVCPGSEAYPVLN